MMIQKNDRLPIERCWFDNKMSTCDQTGLIENNVAVENGCDKDNSLSNGESGIDTDTDYSSSNVNEKQKIMRLNSTEDKSASNCIEAAINAKENHVDSNMNTTSEESMDNANINNNNVTSDETGSSQNSVHGSGINSDGMEVLTSNQTYSDMNQIPVTPDSNHVTMSMTMQPDGQFTSTGTAVGMMGQSVPHGTSTSMPMPTMAGFVPAGPPVGTCHPIQHPGAASPNHQSTTPVTPPQSGASTPNPTTGAANNGNQGTGHQHVVHVHISPGETFTVRVDDQLQHIQGRSLLFLDVILGLCYFLCNIWSMLF
ncbi:putative uncharacterized protein DDB_G0285119 isoform X2 [Ruditapes philippinarum]|uniref:putative uncharacterized protein DDB_G0285119 isoform X2 n=1 Tax=Ruditapes philippinarum TaxID=129788 RepID=UPI00295C2ACB|nr:putative uncharacterized protein DDB_G0285119 isoform X2 [Ruditapes philippinarum]